MNQTQENNPPMKSKSNLEKILTNKILNEIDKKKCHLENAHKMMTKLLSKAHHYYMEIQDHLLYVFWDTWILVKQLFWIESEIQMFKEEKQGV